MSFHRYHYFHDFFSENILLPRSRVTVGLTSGHY